MSNQSTTTFLAIGDVHGQWHRVIDAISEASELLGHAPDMALQVGDAEALRSEAEMAMVAGPRKYVSLGEFSVLKEGDLPCPVYFVAGNHEPYMALDLAEESTRQRPIPWGPDVFYLGRSGALELHGLNVAWLSGIYRPTRFDTRGNGKKSNYHYTAADIEKTKHEAKELGAIDVLVTHDWPHGLERGRGTEHILDLNVSLRPQLHLCGHMHAFHQDVIGKAHVHALNAVPSPMMGDDRFGWWRLYEMRDRRIRSVHVGG